MSVALEEGIERRASGLEGAPRTVIEIAEAALRHGVSVSVVRPAPRDPVLYVGGRAVAAWLQIR